MAENPFVRMYRDLAGRISRLPEVRLSRVDPEAPAEPADGWALAVGRQRVALGAASTPPPVHIATSAPTTGDATGRELGTLWIRRQGGTLAGAWVLTGATTWMPVTWDEATLARISLAKLADGQLSATVRDSLRAQLAVPTSTAWAAVTPASGITGTAYWRIKNGTVYLHGSVTRAAGNFPPPWTTLLTLPSAAYPSLPAGEGLAYKSMSNNAGVHLVGYVGSTGVVAAGAAATNRVDLSTIPPWSV